MLLGIIKDKTNKTKYYIETETNNNNTKISFTAVDNIGIKKLSIEEVRNLLKTILSSNLTYKEKYGEYDVYLDEANNKRYFKNGKENFFMFLRNNGVSAIDCFEKIDKQGKTKRYGIKTATIVFDLILSSTLLIPFIGDVHIENGINTILSSVIPLDTKEVIDLINSSEYLSKEEKEILCNEEYFDFVLENSDSSRNYELRERFNGIKIEAYDETSEISADAYYDPLLPNTIYILENHMDDNHFDELIIHEFIHMTQSDSYGYIKEASDEIFKSEFYNKPIVAYPDCVKRVKALMEIVGPQAIIDCNFKDDADSLDKAIKMYLNEEDANNLIKLFNTPGTVINDPNADMDLINNQIDDLLEKMYYNKTGNEISSNSIITSIYIYNTDDRIYFNYHNENYNKSYFLSSEKELIDELRVDDFVNSYDTDFVNYYENFVKNPNNYTQELTSNSQIAIKDSESSIHFSINFDDNKIASTKYDKGNKTWDKVKVYKKTDYYEPSIPQKFPEQIKPMNNKDMSAYEKEEVKSI